MSTRILSSNIARLVIGAAVAISSAACGGELLRTGRSPMYLVVSSVTGGPEGDDEGSILFVMPEAGLAGLQADWGASDFVLPTAGPAEIEARIRLLAHRPVAEDPDAAVRVGDLVVDPVSYQVRLRGRPLDLTYKEFELLRFLAARPGRVSTRAQLLQEVWGYDFFGGTRTVDVHVRRLRAKLGPDSESMIATVRGVGYKLLPADQARAEREAGE